MLIRILLCFALSLSVSAAVAGRIEIVVGAATSLTEAMTELADDFESLRPDIDVLLTFAASDTLARQISNGAPIDILASADERAMDQAVEAGMIDGSTRRPFAGNRIVLVVPADSSLSITSVDDLSQIKDLQVAMGNPQWVPVGRYTREALEDAGLWRMIEDRIIPGHHARQVLDYVARGEVDAGFVFETDAAMMSDKLRIVQRLAPRQPIRYPIALVARAHRAPEAQAFYDFVLSERGAEILGRHGFLLP